MEKEENSSQPVPLALSDKMSMERTMMAAERTLLAWVRTAMSFISFGFTMYKILESAAAMLAAKVELLQPQHLGLVLIFSGTMPLAVGMYQFYLFSKKYGHTTFKALRLDSFLLAGDM